MSLNNTKLPEEHPDDWGDISDAELLNLQSEHLVPSVRCSVTSEAEAETHFNQKHKKIPKLKAGFFLKVKARWSQDVSIPNVRPMDRFNKSHFSVTQLCAHSWCEIHMIYGLLKPQVRRKEMQRKEVTTGASIHLSREREAHPNVLKVPVITREDKEAVLYLSMLQKIKAIHAGQHVREFPVFGVLEGMFLSGIVDDLRRSDSGELALSDLKTRKHNSFPCPSQARGHFLQVGLYKLLFDSMVSGQLDRGRIILYLQARWLKLQQALGDRVQEQAKTMGYSAATLEELLDVLLAVLASSNIQEVNKLHVEYHHQSTGSHIGTSKVEFQETQLKTELRGYLAYWRGEREPQGVDIEDAWKCTICPHEEICDWRKGQTTDYSNKRAKLDSANSSLSGT
ncbi:exonuclease V [Osmerus mordax]|uniref:exonuclease V n=1 Tax=Osmerus mordax TaxID=8014 RepID=UPI0035106D65